MQDHTEEFAQFKLIRFDQEGVIGDDIAQEIACRIDDNADLPALEPLHDIFIHVTWQDSRNTAGQNQRIASL